MFSDTEHTLVFFVMAIPVLAIAGGIVIGIVRTIGQQRHMELVQRERIAAIERGVDPGKLPPLAVFGAAGEPLSGRQPPPSERARRQQQRFLIGGTMTLAVGIAMVVFFRITEDHGDAWAIGILPIAVALALLLCAWLVRPRGNGES